MKIKDYLNRIERIDQMVRMKATGTPSELANRLGISESTLYQYIGVMKDYGAPIQYSKIRRTYYYQYQVRFYFGFDQKS